ncbi:MAG TPA: hypothetical protein PK812_10310 [Beijerinckiaceae bacterium]|nr:hypothetical protein [Beijerinckiaceae bacterium]
MRLLFRVLSFLATLLAFVMIVVDGTTIISAKEFDYTSLGDLIGRLLAPGALERGMGKLAANVHPLVARLVEVVVLAPPATINLAILALVSWMIGRQRSEPEYLGER